MQAVGTKRAVLCLVLVLLAYCHAQNFTVGTIRPCGVDNLSCTRTEEDVNIPIENVCYNRSNLCDRVDDCRRIVNNNTGPESGEDESGSTVGALNCIREEFFCTGITFIPFEKLCNGLDDCGAGANGNDESTALCANKCLFPYYGGCPNSTLCVSTETDVRCDFPFIQMERIFIDTLENETSVEVCAIASNIVRGVSFNATFRPFSVTAIDNGGTCEMDYSFSAISLNFDENNTRRCVNVAINDDLCEESIETFFVSLTPLLPAELEGIVTLVRNRDRTTINITDNDVLQCADPVGIINGMVTKTGNAIGDTANYICNSGFELIGQATVTCTSINQTFAAFQPPPTCRPLCPDPPGIMNGMRTFTGNSVGDTANYNCDPGFELIGIAITTCTAAVDGNSATFPAVPPPECRPLCPDPPVIINGMRTFTGNSVGDTATYICNPGFELIGIATTTCTEAADGNSATYPAVPPPECRPLCPDPPVIINGMRTFTGNSIGDTANYTCDPEFELIGIAITTCTAAVDGNSATFPPVPPPECRRVGSVIKVNDTVIGDPLFAVPVYVPDLQNLAIGADRVSLCYEIHGQSDEWFNLVTDECISVNAHYLDITNRLNVIDKIAIRAIDAAGNCREILVNLVNCSVELDGVPLNTSNRFSENEITIRRFTLMRRVRVTVPNCQEQSVVMWITCQTRTTNSPVSNDLITFDSIRFDVMRGLNFGHRDSHGIIGQFWNVPIQLTLFNGTLRDGVEFPNGYIINVTRTGSPQRVFAGQFNRLTWDRLSGPCLYCGNLQAGPIYEVLDPNDPVIEGSYRSYRVPSAFDETGYQFGRFEGSTC